MVKSTISRSCSIVMLIFQRVILKFPTCTSPHAFATCCVAIWSHTKSSILTQFWPRFRYFYRISNHPIWRARGKTLSWSFHDFGHNSQWDDLPPFALRLFATISGQKHEVFVQPDFAGDLIELAKCQREQNGREALWVSPNGDINSNSWWSVSTRWGVQFG